MKTKSNLYLLISFLILILLSTILLLANNFKVYADVSESGSKENPILITSESELIKYRDLINKDDDNTYNKKYYKLASDIVLTKASVNNGVATDNFWEAIGTTQRPFKGNFNGDGYVIKNVRLNKTEDDLVKSNYLGLFGKCENANIYRLGVEIESNYLLNETYDIQDINNSSNYTSLSLLGKTLKTSNVIEQIYIGGLAGCISETNIESCYVKFNNFEIQTNSNAYFGALIGYCELSSIKNSYTYAENNSSNLIENNILIENISNCANNCSVGALCGYSNNLIITNCYSNLNISLSSNKTRLVTANKEFLFVGGLVGYVEGVNTYISNNFVLKNVTGNSSDGVLNKGALFGYISFSGFNIPTKSDINYNYYNSNQTINYNINTIGQTCIYKIDETCKKLNNSELLAYETFKNINFNPYSNWDNDIVWSKSIISYDHLKLQCFKSYDFVVKVNNNQFTCGEYEIYINNSKVDANDNYNLKAGNEIKIKPINYNHYKFSFYQFNGLSINESSLFNIYNNELTFTLGEQTAGNIEIYFTPVQYAITIKNDTNGKVKIDSALLKDEETVIYRSYNSTITLIAEPNVGFILNNWTDKNDNVLETKKEYTFVVNGPMVIKANFTSNVYYIDASFSEGGNLFINDEKIVEDKKIMVNKNSKVKVKVEKYEGYNYLGLYNGDTLITDKEEYSFNISKDTKISAKFEIVQSEKSKTNWGLILGIIGGSIGGAGLITLFIILAVRKRRMRNMFRF